ncbi:hypothetical protein NHX12_026433 [Muraenolepis orangiensis]|uniref:Cilia- and flagella-associated protein 206 n=1 Tax=Muraenolepis orangiensis TaxID=630683 RepID=A0A9Q0EM95_9TELE|nr:hypothetical protein NHX12_026433 [Muraenolepis orangiensis]
MSTAHAEGVIKKIIREVGRGCDQKGQAASETLVAFMVKAVVLDPRNEFNVDRKLTQQDVSHLVEMCVDRLTEDGSPSLDTIKMQVYFDMNYTSRSEFLQEHQRVLSTRLDPVSWDITHTRAQTQPDLEDLYRRIVGYVLLSSGAGSPDDLNTVRETTAALQSVFPQPELGTFQSLSRKNKEQQLDELTAVVTGIRLFNKFLKKGGDGIDDPLPATSGRMESSLIQTQDLAWRYTALLEAPPAGESNEPPVLLRQALYNVRQHQALLKVIMADVGLCARQTVSLQTDLASHLQILKEAVQSKTAVATSLVFPQFRALARLWSGLQDQMVLLDVLEAVALGLQPFLLAQSQCFPPTQLDLLLQGSKVRSDEQRMAESADERVCSKEVRGQSWLFPETIENFSELPLQYRGMCNPRIGVLRHQDKYYVFSSREAAERFSSSPDDFTSRVAEQARSFPELIQLLQLHQHFTGASEAVCRSDSSTQTDTHLLETNLVTSYQWNEWELRRLALKLANLRSRVTHSTQTHLSHLRQDISSQTFLPKEASSQSTSVAQTKPFIE